MKDDKNKNFFKIIITGKKANEDGSLTYLFGLRSEEKAVKNYSFISAGNYGEGEKYLLPKNYAELWLVQLEPEKKFQVKELSEIQKFLLLSLAIGAFAFTMVVLYKTFPWKRKKNA